MSEDNGTSAEPEVGTDEWFAAEEAALMAEEQAEREADTGSTNDDGQTESLDASESDAAGQPNIQPEGSTDDDADKAKTDDETTGSSDESNNSDTTTDSDASKTVTNPRVPIEALTSARRETRAAVKQSRTLESQLAEANKALETEKARNEAFSAEAAAQGIELRGEIELKPMTNEQFAALVDTMGEDSAIMMRNQNRMLIAQQEATAPANAQQSDDNDLGPYTKDDVDEAIISNNVVHGWLESARLAKETNGAEGTAKTWDLFTDIEGKEPLVENESAQERFNRIEKLTISAMAEANGDDPKQVLGKKAKAPDKTLDDVDPEKTPSGQLAAVLAMNEDKQTEYLLDHPELAEEVYKANGW